MESRQDYDRKVPLKMLTDFALESNLIQVIEFDTWSRVYNGVKKSSILDHIYVNNITSDQNVKYEVPTFGDHVIAIIVLNLSTWGDQKSVLKRNWKNYNQFTLNAVIKSNLPLNFENDHVSTTQSYWNALENVIINAVDEVAPLIVDVPFDGKCKWEIPCYIKNKINKRKCLLHLDKIRNVSINVPYVKLLNKEINNYFVGRRVCNVRRAADGPKGNIWRAVKLAKYG